MFDTVAAVSTPRGKGGIAVIRISGDDSEKILKRVFRAHGREPWNNPRYAAYGEIVNGDETVDSGVAVFYEAGKSFTGEASAEISCHGGTAVTAAVLESVFAAGALPAPAGEFTKRAFVNGKLSLTEAEAVGRLIDAETDSGRRLARGGVKGNLRNKTEGVRQKLLGVLSALYAAIDYPEEDIGDEGEKNMESVLEEAIGQLRALKRTYKTGCAAVNGVVTVICGAPNCGKSSLYNMLCGKERAIVTDVAGTTRDTLWETVDTGGITLRLADTAGIRETEDKVEEIGVDRAFGCIGDAELIITVFDGSRPLCHDDRRLMDALSKTAQPIICVINKADLEIRAETEEIEAVGKRTVVMSAKTGNGADGLYRAVSEIFNEDNLSLENDALIWDARHLATVENAEKRLSDALAGLRRGDAADAVCTLAEGALAELSLLDGRGVTEEIVGEIFAKFCVGK